MVREIGNSERLITKLHDKLINNHGRYDRNQIKDELAEVNGVTAILVNFVVRLVISIFSLCFGIFAPLDQFLEAKIK